ncbi:MAG: Na/Pi cotransporter family protein, partial [Anaerolineae bacterium]|nr:Na/Pi cotransporter family protein [Anaerolineae bacterium]
MDTTNTIEVGVIIIGLLGGLAIFLYGMEQMTAALKIVAGNRMRDYLSSWTSNKFKGVGVGAFVTAVIQSSSVTTVMVVGFVAASMMTLEQSIGVIMGANIGTTITAHLIAFDVAQFSLVLVAVGFGLLFFSKNEKVRQTGNTIMGLGMIFFGMELMSLAMEPLTGYEPVVTAMRRLDSVLPAIIFGAAFTALVQSSSATTGLVIVLANDGLISLETGIALTLGANIGTSVTAVVGSIGQSREAQQAAAVHVLFNTVGALLWIPLIGPLAEICRQIAPNDIGRQIAWATTIFNVGNTFVFIWFTKPLAKLVRRLIPVRPKAIPEVVQPKYLDDVLLDTPALALDRVRLELDHLGGNMLRMMRQAIPAAAQGSQTDLRALADMDDDVDALHAAIVRYIGQLTEQSTLDSKLTRQAADYLSAANYIENIADVIETNMVDVGLARLEQHVRVSQGTR